ncbi:cobalamin-binding protein [Haliea sp. E1-2-M8]|uniref:cobalamin-binding protein n=1 Tax=Haliea sp. E1-2-M8 TaxID=3064706 RepID=UPI00271C6B45|nr:cobalamin-binding protein [Haliea sp. E1-2-M8]MDO8863583.1 cobalamin-binding protein [Haliea sp. E1-2-M8]
MTPRPLIRLCLLLALSSAARAEPVSVVDFSGRTVTLPAPAQRIVALAPHIVENLYSAGAGDRLVGVVSYSNFPQAARSLPQVGSFNAFSLEQIVAARPDLILMWGSGNGAGALEKLERLGIPIYVSELRELADIPASIRLLGELAGTEASSEAEAVRLEQGFVELAQRYRNAERVSVFYQIWHQPLQTINGEHLISQIIALCGGDNVFADVATLAPRINLESVLVRNPDVIVAGGMGSAHPEWLDDWHRYPGLRALDGGLLVVDPDLIQRPTARVLEGARDLCSQLQRVRERERD